MTTKKVFLTKDNQLIIVTANDYKYVSVTANTIEPILRSEAVDRCRPVGAPVVFVCFHDTLQWWRQGTNSAEWIESIPSDRVDRFAEHEVGGDRRERQLGKLERQRQRGVHHRVAADQRDVSERRKKPHAEQQRRERHRRPLPHEQRRDQRHRRQEQVGQEHDLVGIVAPRKLLDEHRRKACRHRRQEGGQMAVTKR